MGIGRGRGGDGGGEGRVVDGERCGSVEKHWVLSWVCHDKLRVRCGQCWVFCVGAGTSAAGRAERGGRGGLVVFYVLLLQLHTCV